MTPIAPEENFGRQVPFLPEQKGELRVEESNSGNDNRGWKYPVIKKRILEKFLNLKARMFNYPK